MGWRQRSNPCINSTDHSHTHTTLQDHRKVGTQAKNKHTAVESHERERVLHNVRLEESEQQTAATTLDGALSRYNPSQQIYYHFCHFNIYPNI